MPQSQYIDKLMAPWRKYREWPGNSTITVHRPTHGTLRKIQRMTRKFHNHSTQTNPWHHEENTENDQEIPQSRYTDQPMAPWRKYRKWPGNSTITVHRPTHGTMRKIQRMTRKFHNHSTQTNPWHHEENTENDQEIPQSRYTDQPMAPWRKYREWPGNSTITVHRPTHGTMKKIKRMTRKFHNQGTQTNPWHHEENAENDQEIPQSQYTDQPMAPWRKYREWPGNSTITVHRPTHGTMKKIQRITRKCNNHSTQTNPWHHEENKENDQ